MTEGKSSTTIEELLGKLEADALTRRNAIFLFVGVTTGLFLGSVFAFDPSWTLPISALLCLFAYQVLASHLRSGSLRLFNELRKEDRDRVFRIVGLFDLNYDQVQFVKQDLSRAKSTENALGGRRV
jgi:hypothetical protein